MKHYPILLSALLLSPLCWHSNAVYAHAEHDKARFVAASSGQDKGRCDSPVRACRTISYAVKQANKGDKVLVASGEYSVTNGEDLFLLTSALVPVLGGYNKFDHFQSQAPQLNTTVLKGVPAIYAEQLQQLGFRVISDGFAQAGQHFVELSAQHAELQRSHGPSPCVNGKAGVFSCHNMDLVSHLALTDLSSKPSAANDIWGHVDLNTGTEYAIMGLRNGTAFISLANPESPVEIGTIAGTNTAWRDIKVWQFYDNSQARWKAYAYITSEGSDQVQIVDLSGLPNSVRLVNSDRAVNSAHNVYISHVDYTTNTALDGKKPLLHIVGQTAVGGAFTSYGLDNPTTLSPLFPNSNAVRADYTHDAASMVVTDARAQQSCQNDSCTVLMDFNEESVRLWNISQPNRAIALADFTYPQASYIHSGWWSENKRYLYVHDELDEMNRGLQTTVRVFDMADLNQPVLASEWVGPTPAIDHNGYTRGNRYYISNYQRGTTVLDLTNPAKPVEVAYFDSFPSSDSAAFNGVWGTYPFLPSGLIISSDINSGLYVLRDRSVAGAQGQVSFKQASSQFDKNVAVQIQVQRPQGEGAVSVKYETLNGFGFTTQAPLASGQLQWQAGDHADKTITIAVPESQSSAQQMFFVRLFDPVGGLSLAAPSYHQVRIGNRTGQTGTIGFIAADQQIDENAGKVTLQVGRFAGAEGALTVSYRTQDGSAKAGEDYQARSGELRWEQGDTANKVIEIPIVDDNLLENTEDFTVVLTAISGTVSAATSKVSIRDNEVNRSPVLSLNAPAEINAGATTTLEASATDPDGDSISFAWQQTSGPSVTLQNANTAMVTFVAPNQSTSLSFQITATDSRGASSVSQVTLQVRAAAVVVTPPPAASSSGGNFDPVLILLLLAWRLRGKIGR